MTETSEQFAARPIWEPYETILVMADTLEALKLEFPHEAHRMRVGTTLERRKPERYIANTSDVAWWKDNNGNRWMAYGEYRRRI